MLVLAHNVRENSGFQREGFANLRIAAVLSRYASYRRSFDTVNNYYRTLDSVTAADIQAAARKYFTTAGMIVTTLAKDLPPADLLTR